MQIFLVPGAITVFFGAFLLLFLPPSPLRHPIIGIPGYNKLPSHVLQETHDKVEADNVGNERGGSKWSWVQAREALVDVKIWGFLLMATAIYVVRDVPVSAVCALADFVFIISGQRQRHRLRSTPRQIHRIHLVTSDPPPHSRRRNHMHLDLHIRPPRNVHPNLPHSLLSDYPPRAELRSDDNRGYHVLERELGTQGGTVGGLLPFADVRSTVCLVVGLVDSECRRWNETSDLERCHFRGVQSCTFLLRHLIRISH